MGLDNLLEETVGIRSASVCKFARYLQSLAADDLIGVERALEARTGAKYTLSHRELARALNKYGAAATEYSVGDHRQGRCCCERAA